MPATRFALALALLLLAASALLLPGLGLAPLERAEIYFLDGARSMLERGDWLVPYYRDLPFFDKPPLTYWLQALAFGLLGPSPAAGRLVSVVAALLALAGPTARRLWRQRSADCRRCPLSRTPRSGGR